MNNQDVVHAYSLARRLGNSQAALRWCTDDVVLTTTPFAVTTRGREQAERWLDAVFSMFPDWAAAFEGLLAAEDAVAAWGSVQGTLLGAFVTQPPTGHRFRIPVTWAWELRHGLIARERCYFDLNEMCRQLGVDTARASSDLRQIQRLFQDEPEAARP